MAAGNTSASSCEHLSGEHLSVAMATEKVDDVTETTTTSEGVAQSRSSLEFYFQCACLVIGVVGTATNALILYAMVASKQHKKQVLIFNQNVLDLFSCFFLAITYALKLCNLYLTGPAGYWFCIMVDSEHTVWCGVLASKVNLIFVTVERYLKVVHPVWSKKRLRKWMTYSAVAFAWISGFVVDTIFVHETSDVIDGVCHAYILWKSRASQMAFGIWLFLFYHVLLLVTFIFCYWRILIVIRRQAKTMASHSGSASNAVQAQTNQIQSNVVKTMILVSAFYTVSDMRRFISQCSQRLNYYNNTFKNKHNRPSVQHNSYTKYV